MIEINAVLFIFLIMAFTLFGSITSGYISNASRQSEINFYLEMLQIKEIEIYELEKLIEELKIQRFKDLKIQRSKDLKMERTNNK